MKAFEIRPLRRKLRVTVKTVESKLNLPHWSMCGIEDGRIEVTDEFCDKLITTIKSIAAEQKRNDKEAT